MAYMQTPFLPNDSCVAFVLADVTAFVRRLLSLLYIPLVTVTCSAPIWAYSVLPISVTSVPWLLLFYFIFLSPSLFLSLTWYLPLGLFFYELISLLPGLLRAPGFLGCFLSTFPWVSGSGWCDFRPSQWALETPARDPVPGPDRSSAGLLLPRLARWPHLRACLPVAVGLGESISGWMCGGVQTAGPGAPAVSVITFFLLTVPTMVSIGCDILIN